MVTENILKFLSNESRVCFIKSGKQIIKKCTSIIDKHEDSYYQRDKINYYFGMRVCNDMELQF